MTAATPSVEISTTRLARFGVLAIEGPDRAEFLQGQLTQDTDVLESAGTAHAGWASAKGRLLACGQMMAVGDAIWWPLPIDIIDPVARRLDMFKLRANVKIVKSAMPVAGLFDIAEQSTVNIANVSAPLGDRPVTLADGSCIVRVVGDPDRAWLLGPAAESAGISPDGDDDWTAASIRTGLPFIMADTQELFVPQMLNLDRIGAISFTKGCYVGQEIVARTQNLGRIKRRMYRLTTGVADAIPLPGETLYGPGQTTGKVALSVGRNAHAEILAVLPIADADGAWHCDETRSVELTRCPLPYKVDPGNDGDHGE